MLRQALLIEKWVESFDSTKVNNFFYSEAKHRDPILIEQINDDFKRALVEIDSVRLSPNLAEINKQITNTKERLDLGDQNSKNFVIRNNSISPSHLISSKDDNTLAKKLFQKADPQP